MARSATATLAAVLLALVLAVPGSADTKGDLTAAQKQLHGLEDQIAAEQGAIASLQAQADGIAAQRDAIASRIAQTQGKIVEKEAEIKGAQDHLLAVRGQLDRRAWVAFENGLGSNL